MLPREYTREAFKRGLARNNARHQPVQVRNGSTDTHTGLSAARRTTFRQIPVPSPAGSVGRGPELRPQPHRERAGEDGGGNTAVWATGNTRAELWDAMARTRSTRRGDPHDRPLFRGLRLRLKGARRSTPAVAGYAKGVPMGSDLPAAPAGRRRRSSSPRSKTGSAATSIASRSSRDGWARPASRRRRSTTRLVREPANQGATASCPRGNTVDIATATWTNTIGDPELVTVVEGPRLRSVGPHSLLRAHPRDPDAALDDV